jgi:hypothetical protein
MQAMGFLCKKKKKLSYLSFFFGLCFAQKKSDGVRGGAGSSLFTGVARTRVSYSPQRAMENTFRSMVAMWQPARSRQDVLDVFFLVGGGDKQKKTEFFFFFVFYFSPQCSRVLQLEQ